MLYINMNLSKTEKLLAAKKKLKEFQLSKMMQDGSTKRQQTPTSDQPPSHNQYAEGKKTDPEVSLSETTMPEVPENFIVLSDQDVGNNTLVPLATASENVPNHKETVNSTVGEISNSNEDIDSKLSNDIASVENIPTAQKKHLLEMASAVANALTNDSEHVESSLDCELASRNQFLNSHLEEQKRTVTALHMEVSNYRSTISELEAKLATRESEFQVRLAREIDPLKEQLHTHTQATGILIAEKAELTAALSQTQQAARQNAETAEELSGKLKISQTRVCDLEKEVSALKNNNDGLLQNYQQLQVNYNLLENNFFELRKQKEDLSLETSELKQKLNMRKTELVALQQELQEKTSLLSLSELRVQQMKDASQSEEETHSAIVLQQELVQVKETLKVITDEKEEASKQYQNYIRQLDAQQTKLLDEIKTQKKIIEDLSLREQSYVQRLSELEQQLQQERQKMETLLPLQDRKDEMHNLLRNIDELTLQQERLHITLSEKDTQIEVLMRENKELRETNNQNVEVTKLVTALESEQLGASRAVHQNQSLKQQLTDMENAFVSLSNDKLDLTEQLQAERSIGRKLNVKLNSVETELDEMKEKLKEKEAVLIELEKEKLQTAQIADQMQHYQAQSYHADTFQRELQHAFVCIENLEKEKQQLLEKLKEKNQNGNVTQNNSAVLNENHHTNVGENGIPENPDKNNLILSEPTKTLEKRFKETMERVAELTEEKQRLEHLVLQLQSETETIGEYITLYQKQRAILQSKAREREDVFRQLLEQRNQQQEQLHKLKVMVSEFLRKEFIQSDGTEATPLKENDLENCAVQKPDKPVDSHAIEEKNISEILDLLTEIKDCKDTCTFEPNFHPCPWCSGKLITV